MITLNEKEKQARQKICLPLDNLYTLRDLQERVEEQSPYVGMFKIGKGSFTRFGSKAVASVLASGSEVFLDLKYHDIPNTVEDAAYAAAELGVSLFNVHASGGVEMMNAAVKGAKQGAEAAGHPVPKIVGVTVLTSFDVYSYLQTFQPLTVLRDFNFDADQEDVRKILEQHSLLDVIQKQVLHLAKLSYHAGLDGIVSSAEDLFGIRDQLPSGFFYVTPGIKGVSTSAGKDQKRIMTPGNAIDAGSSLLVVGRAITDKKTAEERQQAAYEIVQDVAQHL